ncbi:MAG: hypothetical protein J6S82_05660 [Bacteroidales bacterium]|nr:hypothetical protein [Bacteroidales bacterium]
MRKKIGIIAITACLLWTGISLVSCRKDAVCKAIITARYLRNGNSNEVVPGCTITVGEPEFADSVRFVGTTGPDGRLEHTWRNEAKLKVVAEIDGHKGAAMLHLVKGETVELDVQIPVE